MLNKVDIIYVDILTGVNLSSILVAYSNIDLVYWPVRSCSRRGGDGIKGLEMGIIILASYSGLSNWALFLILGGPIAQKGFRRV